MIPRTLFGEEHEIFRESVRRFVAAEIAPHHEQWERDGVVGREAWLKAGEAGILLCDVPEDYGGAGAGFLFSAIVVEELARAQCSGPFFSLHSDIVAPYILHYGSEEQKRRWLPPMARGEAIGAIAMTEPAAGSDLQGIRTTALRDGDELVLNGQKVFISNGQLADIVIVACKTDPEAGAKGVSLVLVEGDRPGFRRGRNLEKLGLKAQDTSELFFADVRVPAANLLGEAGRGFYQLMTELAQERLLQAIRAAATIEAALDWTVEYTSERQAFGRSVGSFQNTRFTLAGLKAEAAMLRTFVDRCIELHLEKQLGSTDAAMCKLVSTDLQVRAVDQCLQFFGGYGYMWEFPIARAWADARMTRIAGGSAEIMKQIIGREMFEGR